MRTLLFSTLLFSAMPGAIAQAQGTAGERSACMGDAFRFCSAYIPNVTAIEECLLAKKASLSRPCQAEFTPAGRTLIQERHFR